jgi:hypothetical protein
VRKPTIKPSLVEKNVFSNPVKLDIPIPDEELEEDEEVRKMIPVLRNIKVVRDNEKKRLAD